MLEKEIQLSKTRTKFPKKRSLILTVIIFLLAFLSACGNESVNNSGITQNDTAAQLTSIEKTPEPTSKNTVTTNKASASTTRGQVSLTKTTAKIKKANDQFVNMTIELAQTEQEQTVGLMGRQALEPDSGMLFVFPKTGRITFWMKDTPLPLSIAFIDSAGKIVDIKDMKPFSEDLVNSSQDFKFALEVTQGYFTENGIKPGDVFTIGA